MSTRKIAASLDTYAALTAHAAAQAASFDAERAALLERINPAIRQALASLDAEQASAQAEMQAHLDALATSIKRAVVPLGHSVKGTSMQAVYTPGRPRWNDQMLQGLALAHPAIVQARTVGEPSVALRPVATPGDAR